uniref:Alpha-amylase/branching enzyme C-terminal all beta domain-containing protein n=1 Tax=Panagrolaimus sp. ES5 TaxID=591445 RepID=A0AC34FGE0_9BILA
MDKEMYDFMSVNSPFTPVIERGIALHNIIRLLTYGLGGEAWLNFIGNEFGHPEWLDFPRVGNNESFHYCRRQFNLADDPNLRYKFMNLFDQAMNEMEAKHQFLSRGPAYVTTKHGEDKVVVFERGGLAYVTTKHGEDKVVVFERGGLVFVFNLHTTKAYTDYWVATDVPGQYRLALDSDSSKFGGHGRLNPDQIYSAMEPGHQGRRYHLSVYIPPRVAIVLERV